jgi:hypothetical protein
VRWYLSFSRSSGLGVLYFTYPEAASKFGFIKILSEFIDASYLEVATEGINSLIRENLVVSKIIVSHEPKARLTNTEAIRDLPSLKKKSEVVSTVVGVMHFSDLTGIISQVIVNNVGNFIIASVESKDFAVVVEELLF